LCFQPYYLYADVVKTKSNKEAIVRYLKIPQEDLLGYEYGLRKGAVFQPSYFVSYDQGHEAVVLGIRGTWVKYNKKKKKKLHISY
jgi:hypothetical protein